MEPREQYSPAQLDLLRRIERMGISDELRKDIRELRGGDSAENPTGQPEVVKGESRTIGFTTNY